MLRYEDSQKAQSRMEAKRSNVENAWAEIGPLLLDVQGHFRGQFMTEGQDRATRRFDSYAALALAEGVAGFIGFVMPKGQRWQKFRVADDKLNMKPTIRAWLETLEQRLFALRYDPQSGFTWNVQQSACSLFAFGMQSMWPDIRRDVRGRAVGLSYQSEHLQGIFCEQDAEGRNFRVHRKIMLTAEQAIRKWGDRAPEEVRKAMTGSSPQVDRQFTFVHVIEPNSAIEPQRIDWKGKPWSAAYYLEGSGGELFDMGGYFTMRRTISMFDRASNETYGRCPAMMILPEIRASQVMKQDRVIGVEIKAKPPILAADDELDRGTVSIEPYGITYAGIDEMGRAKFQTWMENADLSEAVALTEEDRAMIDRAFFRDLYQINKEYKTHITATRTLEEIAEKGILLGPLARQEDEWLSRMTESELSLMDQLGWMDDMPGELAEYFEAEGGMDIVYDNPLARMQEADGAVGFLRTAEQVTGLSNVDPAYMEAFKGAYDPKRIVPWLGYINGIPAMLERDEDDKAAYEAEMAQQRQMQELLQAAPVIADTAKNLAAAEGGFVGA
jgi:hypothetical protein